MWVRDCTVCVRVCEALYTIPTSLRTWPHHPHHINYCLVISHTGTFPSFLPPYLISSPIFIMCRCSFISSSFPSFHDSSPSPLLPLLSCLIFSFPIAPCSPPPTPTRHFVSLLLNAAEPLDLISTPNQTCHILTCCHCRIGDVTTPFRCILQAFPSPVERRCLLSVCSSNWFCKGMKP